MEDSGAVAEVVRSRLRETGYPMNAQPRRIVSAQFFAVSRDAERHTEAQKHERNDPLFVCLCARQLG